MKFWLLWNFCVNLLISSLERDILFWWEREGCRVRRGEERNEEQRKEGLDFLIWCSQENKVREKTFGAAKGDKRRGPLGWNTCMARERKITPTFQLLAFTLTLSTKNNITLHTHTHTYIYIYPYLYKVISITLKEHRCSIISQYQNFMHLKVIKIITCI